MCVILRITNIFIAYTNITNSLLQISILRQCVCVCVFVCVCSSSFSAHLLSFCCILMSSETELQTSRFVLKSLSFSNKVSSSSSLSLNNCNVRVAFIPWEIRVAVPGESQLQQSRATRPTVHDGCCSVSIIHRTLTWTTGSLTCAQM